MYKKSVFSLFVLILALLVFFWGRGFFEKVLFPSCEPASPSTVNCSPRNTVNAVNLSINEAVEHGFPLYLPSTQTVKIEQLVFPPEIYHEVYNSACSYLIIPIERQGQETPIVALQISNGCAYPLPSSMYTSDMPLSWAENGKAYLIDDHEEPIIVIKESMSGFQYLVFFEEPLNSTIDLLESMEYIHK